MQIHGLQSTTAAQSISRAAGSKPNSAIQSAPAVNPSTTDQLDLSAEAQQIAQSQASAGQAVTTGGIRADKVSELRQAIANGTYETPERMSAALDRMLDTFA
ncbi:MAG: flagellar biosynthesis anti-sigma factor FlgM [Pirellulaceae bacterium]